MPERSHPKSFSCPFSDTWHAEPQGAARLLETLPAPAVLRADILAHGDGWWLLGAIQRLNIIVAS